MEASISDDRKCALLNKLHWMKYRDKCTKHDILSPVGYCHSVVRCFPAGWIFLCRMVKVSNTVTNLQHGISLTTEACLDILWWFYFLPGWPDMSLILSNRRILSVAYTNASGLHGWGAHWDGRWLQPCWSVPQTEMDITWKELFAILLAVYTWVCFWTCQKILFHCDNQSIVDIWDKGSTHVTHTMALVHYFLCQYS